MTGIVEGLFGGSDAREILERFRPAGFNAPGLSGRFVNNRFMIQRGPQARRAIGDIRSGRAGQAAAFRDRAGNLLARIEGLSGIRGQLRGLRPGFRGVRANFRGLRGELGGLRGDLRGLRPGLGRLRADIRDLRGDVRPGFGRLTRSRVAALNADRARAVGNLREELAMRRVAGSSFAESQVGGLEAEFAREEDLIRAESFLQEMDATNQLIAQELGLFGAEAALTDQEASLIGRQAGLTEAEAAALGQEANVIAQTFGQALQEAELGALAGQDFIDAFNATIAGAQTELNQLNIETGIGAELSALASQLMNQNLTAQAEAEAAESAGVMNFLGDILGSVATIGLAGGFGDDDDEGQ